MTCVYYFILIFFQGMWLTQPQPWSPLHSRWWTTAQTLVEWGWLSWNKLPSIRTFSFFARSGDQKVRGVLRLSSLLHLQPRQPDEEETPGRTDWNKGRQLFDESYAATCWDDKLSDDGNIVSYRMVRLVPTNTMLGRRISLWSTYSLERRLSWVILDAL